MDRFVNIPCTLKWLVNTFVAPEVIKGEPQNKSTDVYSFGVIIWEVGYSSHTHAREGREREGERVNNSRVYANRRLPGGILTRGATSSECAWTFLKDTAHRYYILFYVYIVTI